MNHGTIFTVTLPIYRSKREGRNGRGKMAETILIVDDEVEILELLELIITDKTGYRVVTSSNSLEVLEILGREKPDLLITDLRMPEVDGMELLVGCPAIGPRSAFHRSLLPTEP